MENLKIVSFTPQAEVVLGEVTNLGLQLKNTGDNGEDYPAGSLEITISFPDLWVAFNSFVSIYPNGLSSYFKWVYDSNNMILVGTNTLLFPGQGRDGVVFSIKGTHLHNGIPVQIPVNTNVYGGSSNDITDDTAIALVTIVEPTLSQGLKLLLGRANSRPKPKKADINAINRVAKMKL